MSQNRMILGILAMVIGAIAALVLINSIQPQSWRSSKHPDPYLHIGKTAQ
jgi:hypothetical protein